MHAKRLHLLIPFSRPPAAQAPTLLRELELPALEKLLRHATLVEHQAGDDFQRTLPHERWLARSFGLIDPSAQDEAPLAAHMLLADGGTPGTASWACIEPVHIRIARDHLVLIDPDTLALQSDEAARLLADARPLVEELGLTLVAPNPLRWYLSGEALGRLASASPLRASGRSVEIWLPQAVDAAAGSQRRSPFWMKLQNEVQMAWFEHPVNEAREQRGQLAANSIWLHSQGALAPPGTLPLTPYTQVFADAPATRGLGAASRADCAALPPTWPLPALGAGANAGAGNPAQASQSAALLQFDQLTMPFLHEDWYAWRTALSALERDWLAPALAALEDKTLDAVTLTLCGETSFITLKATRADLRKFWRRRSLVQTLSA